jgi:hypothetical protein
MQEQKLNPRNYSKQEIIMRNFVQATEYEMYMHAMFEYLDIYLFLKLIISRFELYKFYRRQYRSKVTLVKPKANIF